MTESRSDLSLNAALRVMSPLVEMLLKEGITYPCFANALKQVFIEAAQNVIESSSVKVNDSRISTLSGIHRKDVREWHKSGKPLSPAKPFSAAMEVYTRWASDPAYCNDKGEPRLLARTGEPGSFEELATSVSTDVHPRAVLEELLRLGVVKLENKSGEETPTRLRLCAGAFVPREGYSEMLQIFADNVADHIATAAYNLKGGEDTLLEQSVFADNLTAESAATLSALSSKLWAGVFQEMVRAATHLTEQDKDIEGAKERVRLGMYFYRNKDE